MVKNTNKRISAVAGFQQKLDPSVIVERYFAAKEVPGAVEALGRSLAEIPLEVLGRGIQSVKATLLATSSDLDVRIVGLSQEVADLLAQLAAFPESQYPDTWQTRPSLVAWYQQWRNK